MASTDRRLSDLLRDRGAAAVRGIEALANLRTRTLRDRLTALERADSHMMRIVRHGSDRAARRPDWPGVVVWIGSVRPDRIGPRDQHWREG